MCLQLSGTVDTVDTRDAAVITPTSGQCGAWSRSPSCLLLIVMSNTAARVTRDT